MPLQGAVDVVPLLQGAIVVCNFGGVGVVHCSVLWLGGRVTTNFGGVDVVPLLGAIAGCHCSVLWLEGGHFFLYIDNAKIGFCYLGSMPVLLCSRDLSSLFVSNFFDLRFSRHLVQSYTSSIAYFVFLSL